MLTSSLCVKPDSQSICLIIDELLICIYVGRLVDGKPGKNGNVKGMVVCGDRVGTVGTIKCSAGAATCAAL